MYSLHQMLFLIEAMRVLCEVRTESLHLSKSQFKTLTDTRFTYKFTFANRCYVVRLYPRHPQGALHQDLKFHHHHKHQALDPLTRSVSTVTAARANASSVFQLFSFLAVCSGMVSKGFGLVAFFASVKASSVCIHLSCPVCL